MGYLISSIITNSYNDKNEAYQLKEVLVNALKEAGIEFKNDDEFNKFVNYVADRNEQYENMVDAVAKLTEQGVLVQDADGYYSINEN